MIGEYIFVFVIHGDGLCAVCCWQLQYGACHQACEYFGVKHVRIPFDDKYVMSIAAATAAVTRNTIAIYASAPCFPFGTTGTRMMRGVRVCVCRVCARSPAVCAYFVHFQSCGVVWNRVLADPIEELAKVAVARGCGLHVDNCMGGFVMSYLQVTLER